MKKIDFDHGERDEWGAQTGKVGFSFSRHSYGSQGDFSEEVGLVL